MNKLILAGVLSATAAMPAFATTQVTWWHAMGGQLGETVNKIATDFNASQDDYKITPIYKGSYTETLTAGIAAYRAGEAPNILQVFDAGAATIMNAKGVAKPVKIFWLSLATTLIRIITWRAFVTSMQTAKAR